MKKLIIAVIAVVLFGCSKSAMISESDNQVMKSQSLMESVSEDTLRPVANGSTIENYPNWGGAGMNYWCAADTNNYGVNNMYLYETTSGPNVDLYTVVNSIPAGATINSVTVYGNGCTNPNKGVGSPGTMNFAVRENSTTSFGSTITLAVGWGSFPQYSHTWTVRPSDSQPWTKADIDALEIGFSQTRPGGIGFTKTGHIYCVVNYN